MTKEARDEVNYFISFRVNELEKLDKAAMEVTWTLRTMEGVKTAPVLRGVLSSP
jgi:hypothetical protein